jgi:parallel beta-helix repeat protein
VFLSFFVYADNGTDVIVDEDVILDEGSRSYCGGEVACHCGDIVIEDAILTEDLYCPGYDWGLKIENDNITLNCDGYSIRGSDRVDSVGVKVESSSNILENCIVNDWFHGMTFIGGLNQIVNNEIHGNTHQGIYLVHSGASENQISNNLIYQNLNGIAFYASSNENIITENILLDNFLYGIYLLSDNHYNSIFLNTISNSENVYEDQTSTNNYWNDDFLGNCWSDFESNPGFPDYYEIPGPGNGIDYYPWCDSWDPDEDGIPSIDDNCPLNYNPEQEDYDVDGVGDVCDNCYRMSNSEQENSDEDIYGDVCDNCAYTTNPSQSDFDEDRIGDWCDNCIMTWNHYQLDDDENGVGNSCEGMRYQCYDAHSIDPGNTGVTP